MAVSSQGWFLICKPIRKNLISKTRCQHVERMYQERTDGSIWHIGYIVQNAWYRIYGLEGDVFERKVGQNNVMER